MKIPQMFYLRKQTLWAKTLSGNKHCITVHIYWNYRLTVQGLVYTPSRRAAKAKILAQNPDAEFFR